MTNLLSNYVVVMNGPPRSGKDTLARLIRGATSVVPRAFKTKLIEIALEISGVDRRTWDNWYEHAKELPRAQLWGHSCRSFLIMVSEDMIKPNLGQAFFGAAAANDLLRNKAYLEQFGAIFTDSGFPDELKEVVAAVGADRVIVVQLHRCGTSFEGDSRQYLIRDDFPGVEFIQQQNDRPVENVAADLVGTLQAVINEKRKNGFTQKRISSNA